MNSSSRYPLIDSAQAADVLQPTALHDFSDLFRELDGRLNRPLIVVLIVAVLLTIGHLSYPASSIIQAADAARMAEMSS
jgi:hypothetical protein